MKYLKYLFICILMGCSSSKVVYDYDTKEDFSKYKTYAFFDDVGAGLNEIDTRRFTRSIERYLDSLGLKKVKKPDFYINVISERNEVPKNNNIGIGVGSGGGRRGGTSVGVTTGVSLGGNKIKEEIAIDFVAANNNQLFWQGVITKKYSDRIKPRTREAMVKEIIITVLSKFPPKK